MISEFEKQWLEKSKNNTELTPEFKEILIDILDEREKREWEKKQNQMGEE